MWLRGVMAGVQHAGRRTVRALLTAALAAGATAPGAAAQGAPSAVPPVGSAHGGAASAEARSVRGRVLRGGRTALQPLVGGWVVLHRVGTDRAGPLDSVRTDAAGRYGFSYRTSGDPNAVYFASCTFGGIAYFSAPFLARAVSGGDAELLVHDTTSAPVPIHVRARHVVLEAPGDDRRTVVEIFELSNDSTVTRVAAGDTGVVWQSLLLDGARDAHVGKTDFSSGAVRFESGRVRLSAPFAPGLKQFSFTYTVPAGTDYAFPVEEPADVLEVLVEDSLARAEGAGLASSGPTNVSGRTFARFLGHDVGAGAVVRITAPGDGAASDNRVRILAVMAALGAALLVGLARAMMRRGGARRPSASEDSVTLRARLAALDEAFANIASPSDEQRADHWQARAHLTQQITDAVAREQGLP